MAGASITPDTGLISDLHKPLLASPDRVQKLDRIQRGVDRRHTLARGRCGSWVRYQALVRRGRRLVVLDGGPNGGPNDETDDRAAYAEANQAIIREARALAGEGAAAQRLVAVVVWEGAARSGNDATDGFRQLAAAAGFEGRAVLTR